MNERQRLYLVQARSDWMVFALLRDQPVCHQLHYLQMCTEKLAKAYFWRGPSASCLGHAAFVMFLRSIATNRRVGAALRFSQPIGFREWIKAVSDLAGEIEKLAPSLAGTGPNPEYPWPRDAPRHAPVEEVFVAWERFNTSQGWTLRRLLDLALGHFEEWF